MVETYALGIAFFVMVAAMLLLVVDLCAAMRKSPCRWRRVAGHDRFSFKYWQCARCGEEAYSRERRPPKECKRALRNSI